MTDEDRLQALLRDERLNDREREAFEDMLEWVQVKERPLTPKQHAWVTETMHRLELDAGELSGPTFASGRIPRGRPVEMPEVLKVDPKKILPPNRRRT